jgi:WD40 repeat protein/tetratricopeptide (TPR) repeat protein
MNNQFPYPGLRPYEQNETDIFFGREEHTDQLLEKLRQTRFLAIVGPSGCGKSSLARAGLLAGLRAGFLSEAGIHWRIAEMRPGNSPYANLAQALLDKSILGNAYADFTENNIEAAASLSASLSRGPFSLHEILQNTPLPPDTHLLLLVDQFEEIFRYYEHGKENVNEAAAFVSLLLTTAQQTRAPIQQQGHINIYVVITMRDEYIHECALFQGLPEAINQGIFLPPRLTRDQLREAIELPAQVFGDKVEPALVNRLLNKISNDQDQLPVLQHALMRMWRLAHAENPEQAILSLKHYEKIGGLEKALSQHADKAYAELDPAQQKVAETLFRNLTGANNTRRPVKLAKIATLANVSTEQIVAVVEIFRQEGRSFLTPPLGKALTPETVLDISHESLIRLWQRLKNWTEEEAESAKLYQRLEDSACRWNKGQVPLLQSPELEVVLAWYEKFKPTHQWATRYGKYFELATRFLTESEKAQRRQKQRHKIWISTAFGVISLFGAYSYFQWQTTEQLKQQVEQTQSLLLADLAQQETLKGNAANGILFALEALPKEMSKPDKPYVAKAERQLYNAVSQLRERTVLKGHKAVIFHLALSPDGQRLVTASEDKTARLWDINTRKQLAVLLGHKNKVLFAEFSPDGKKVLTASEDRTARLWEANTGKQLKVLLGHKGTVRSAKFSPDGKKVVTASEDMTTRLWNVNTGKQLIVLRVRVNKFVKYAEFSYDGQLIVTRLGDKTAYLWDANTGELLSVLSGHKNYIQHAAFSPDGQRVITTSGVQDNTARLWDSRSGEQLNVLEGHKSDVYLATFSPDGQHVATVSYDNTARLWDINNTGKQLAIMQGHKGNVYNVNFSPDGQRLITASDDNTARLWDSKTGKQLAVLSGHTGRVRNAIFSTDGQQIITISDSTIRLWDINPGLKPLFILSEHKGPVKHAIFIHDGQRVVTASADKTVRLWNANNGKPVDILKGHIKDVSYVELSPNGQQLLTASGDNTAILWNINSGKPTKLVGHEKRVKHATFSPNGQLVITVSYDHTARLWNANTGQELVVLKGHSGRLRRAAFSPNGQFVVTASVDDSAIIWDVKTGKPLNKLVGHNGNVEKVVFSQDGQRILTASLDWTARLWNVTSGEELGWLPHRGHIRHAAFSPNGKTVITVSKDKTAKLWSTSNLKLLKTLRGHKNEVFYAAFSPDGRKLITTSFDNTARLWDTESGQELAVMQGHKRDIYHASFSPDGKQVVTASQDNTARIWQVFSTTQALIDYANKIVPRCLTSEQRQQFFLPKSQSQALLGKGQALAQNGQIEAAIIEFEQAIKLEPCLKLEPAEEAQQIAVNVLMETGQKWAQQGQIETAVAEFQKALAIDSNLKFDPDNKARQMAANVLVENGEKFAQQAQIDAAVAEFQKALAIDANLKFDPDNKARQIAANVRVNQGEQLALQENFNAAVVKFQEALALDADLHFNPANKTWRIIANVLMIKADKLARQGKIEEALAIYEQIPAGIKISPYFWKNLCWYGSLQEQAFEVMEICTKAVALEPENEWYRRTRGINSALNGDTQGAIEDFRFFVEKTPYNDFKLQVQDWLGKLRRCENPLTPIVIHKLLRHNNTLIKLAPDWCAKRGLKKEEKVICDNDKLWDIGTQNHIIYQRWYDSLAGEEQYQAMKEFYDWLEYRNALCLQSVDSCLQVYKERVKLLNSRYRNETWERVDYPD